MNRNVVFAALAAVAAAASSAPPARATAPPDSATNPQSGYIETASIAWNGHDVVRVTVNRGSLPSVTTTLETCIDECDEPRIAIDAAGTTWVAWSRTSAGEVVVRRHAYGATSWSAAVVVSGSGEYAAHPSIAVAGSTLAVAYVTQSASASNVNAVSVTDEPTPIAGATLGSTGTDSESVDARMSSESGDTWVTWIDDSGDVAWSQHDAASGEWSAPSHQELGPEGSEGARSQIRSLVLMP